MIPIKLFIQLSILLIIVLTIIMLSWSILTIRNKRGFTLKIEKINGSITERKNWELGKNIIMKNFDFSGRLIIVVNFIIFYFYKTWVFFGEDIGLAGIALIIILLPYESMTSLYKWIKDESEKRYDIKERKKEK